MKLSDKQALLLYQIAVDTLKIVGADSIFTYDRTSRLNLVNTITQQQDDQPTELELKFDGFNRKTSKDEGKS